MDLTTDRNRKLSSLDEVIYLYGDGIGRVEYFDHMGTDKTIVNAARVSYGKRSEEPLNERDEKLINYLIRNEHTSTLEHNVLTLRLTVPLFVRSQHHRHRVWSYNEKSLRYAKTNKESFYCPEILGKQDETNKQGTNLEEKINPKVSYKGKEMSASQAIKKHSKEESFNLYNQLIEKGVSKEQARIVLPLNTYTEYIGTVNLNNILKFIDLRIDEHAQWEAQQVAKACLIYANHVWPNAIKIYQEHKNQKE